MLKLIYLMIFLVGFVLESSFYKKANLLRFCLCDVSRETSFSCRGGEEERTLRLFGLR